MKRSATAFRLLEFIKDKEKVDYDEIKKYFLQNTENNSKQNIIFEINDCIFDLVVEGILKVGIVYSYGSSSSQYFVDKEMLIKKFILYKPLAC